MQHNQLTARNHYIPPEANCVELSHVNAVVYIKHRYDGKIQALGFTGKRSKPDFNYLYKNENCLHSYLNEWQIRLEVMPVKDNFISEPLRKKIGMGNSVRIESFSRATLWGGRACYRSWYA